jgi:TPR repeat protein
VERAEIRCIEAKDGDACLRAADAHAAGNVVALDDKRAKRFASIARTHYINQCEAQSSLACQRLSLLYRAGEGVRQSTWTADRLLARSREHCHLRKNREFCAALDRP